MLRQAKLSVQPMEDRLCLSTVVAFDNATDTLAITGDQKANQVKVIHDDFSNKVHVQHDGINEVFTSTDIKKILVDLKGGNDTFTESLAEGTNFVFGKAVDINVGNGRDTVLLDLAGNANHWATLKEDLSVVLHAGAGADKVQLNLPYIEIANHLTFKGWLGAGADQFDAIAYGAIGTQGSVNVTAFGEAGGDSLSYHGTYDPQAPSAGIRIADQAVLGVFFDGGAGQDQLDATYTGEVDGLASFYLHGDQQDVGVGQRDRISIHTFTRLTSTGTMYSYALGGKGKDTVEFLAEGANLPLSILHVDGGVGLDKCVNTYNVGVANCEL